MNETEKRDYIQTNIIGNGAWLSLLDEAVRLSKLTTPLFLSLSSVEIQLFLKAIVSVMNEHHSSILANVMSAEKTVAEKLDLLNYLLKLAPRYFPWTTLIPTIEVLYTVLATLQNWKRSNVATTEQEVMAFVDIPDKQFFDTIMRGVEHLHGAIKQDIPTLLSIMQDKCYLEWVYAFCHECLEIPKIQCLVEIMEVNGTNASADDVSTHCYSTINNSDPTEHTALLNYLAIKPKAQRYYLNALKQVLEDEKQNAGEHIVILFNVLEALNGTTLAPLDDKAKEVFFKDLMLVVAKHFPFLETFSNAVPAKRTGGFMGMFTTSPSLISRLKDYDHVALKYFLITNLLENKLQIWNALFFCDVHNVSVKQLMISHNETKFSQAYTQNTSGVVNEGKLDEHDDGTKTSGLDAEEKECSKDDNDLGQVCHELQELKRKPTVLAYNIKSTLEHVLCENEAVKTAISTNFLPLTTTLPGKTETLSDYLCEKAGAGIVYHNYKHQGDVIDFLCIVLSKNEDTNETDYQKNLDSIAQSMGKSGTMTAFVDQYKEKAKGAEIEAESESKSQGEKSKRSGLSCGATLYGPNTQGADVTYKTSEDFGTATVALRGRTFSRDDFL